MDATISIGPVILPGAIIVFFVALLVARLVLFRYRVTHSTGVRWIIDRGTNALILAFVVWKLWPVTRWWSEIIADPVILLRMPGGVTGAAVGVAVALLLIAPGIVRERERRVPAAGGALGLVVGFFLGVALVNTLVDTPSGVTSLETADATAPLTTELINGEHVPILTDDLPTVITFWATWCGPCRAELPVKKRLFSEYGTGDSATIRTLAVNMTPSESSVAAVNRYVAEHGITYPVALDRDGSLARLFAVRGTPTTIVLDADGTVIARWTGPSSLERLERAIPDMP